MGKRRKQDPRDQANSQHIGLSAPAASLDPVLSSLFASSSGPVKPNVLGQALSPLKNTPSPSRVPSPIASDSTDLEDSPETTNSPSQSSVIKADDATIQSSRLPPRKRRKIDPTEDLEARYFDRLAREDIEENAIGPPERPSRHGKATEGGPKDFSPEAGTSIPLHETVIQTTEDSASLKNDRTVFFGNVSTSAIKSKSAKKTLLTHLSAFLPSLPQETSPHKIVSIRFRSVAFSNAIPRKAAYAKKEVMDETTNCTNVYAVYSTEPAARAAIKHLNGTVVLDRHLRADLVAHPSKIAPRRCIFVGNLSFVDEESSQPATAAAEDETGQKMLKTKKKKSRPPSDPEEGLWRTFAKCGQVESVRVVRDKSTRVGKGFAYVQFADENAVEAALLLNEKSFPPMLPRRLRVVRARGRAVKREGSGKGGSGREGGGRNQGLKGSGSVRDKGGSRGKGRGRGQGFRRTGGGGGGGGEINKPKPESSPFVFEGHRASKTKDRVPGSKLKAKSKSGSGSGKKPKPENRSTRRAAAYRAANANANKT